MPGAVACVLFLGAWCTADRGCRSRRAAEPGARRSASTEFAVAFLNEYWLHFELTSVLLLAAVVAAMAVIRSARADHG